MKRVICFDLWNTLINTPKGGGASYEDVLVSLGITRELIYPIVRDELMTKKFSYDTMVDFLFHHFGINGHNPERKLAAQNWEEDNLSAEWFEGAKELLKKLKQQGDDIVLISNISLPSWQTVGELLQITKPFDHSFLSCHENLAKPNPLVWLRVQNWYKEPCKFWMIGDNQEDDLNIPQKMGWKTILVSKDGSEIKKLFQKLEEGNENQNYDR